MKNTHRYLKALHPVYFLPLNVGQIPLA